MARQAEPWRRGGEGGAWYSTVGGKQVRLADPEATKAQAWEVLHRLLAGREKVARRPPEQLTAGDVLRLWLEARAQASKDDEGAMAGVKEQGRKIVSAVEAFGSIPVSLLRPLDVERWMDRPSWGPTTRNNAVRIVKLAFSWAEKIGHIPANPIVRLSVPRAVRREEVMTREEYDRLLERMTNPDERDLIQVLRETGARPRELATLTADRVDLAGGRCQVENKTRNSGGTKLRAVYLSAVAVEIIRRRLAEVEPKGLVFKTRQGREWNRKRIFGMFRRGRKRSGLGKGCTAYALRHMFVTDALERGVAPAIVAELAGHTSANMVMRVYNKLRDRTDHLREAIKQARTDRTD